MPPHSMAQPVTLVVSAIDGNCQKTMGLFINVDNIIYTLRFYGAHCFK